MTKKTDLCEIKMIVLDVDGVLTNGTLVINADGTESKHFNSLDGHGIRMWQRAGHKVAIISGRTSKPTEIRAAQLDIAYCMQECHHKLPALEELMAKTGLSANQLAYIGDDLPDLPPIMHVGFGVAVANAPDEVKKNADFVTTRNGGSGAVREVIEYILKNTGQWQPLLKRYLP